MANLEAFYLKLPVPLQNLICSIEGWRIQATRFGGSYQSIRNELKNRASWTITEAVEFRDKRLRAFVQHCAHTVPYYQRQFAQLGISPDEIRTLADLERLPILTKADVQNNYTDLVSQAVPRPEQIIGHTSGTTGGGLRFATTLRATQEQWATWWRYRSWHGLEPGTWCGYFGGRSVVPLAQREAPFWRFNVPGRQIMFSGYHMNKENMRAYVNELRRKRPLWLHGYPSLLSLMAGHIVDSGTDLGYQVRWVTIGAENLLPHQCELIERAFGVRPRQHYGMAEAVANVSECELGNLHVDEDFAATEFLPGADGSYRVIGTNLTNLATPLLRYDVQDRVMLSEQSCSCGRPGRIIAEVDGRQEDFVLLKNGARLGRLDHIFKDMTNIREAQILQKTMGEVIIRVVRGAGYTEVDEALLLREAGQRLGADTDLLVEYVPHLQRSQTGKLRFVVSTLPEGQVTSEQRSWTS